MWARHYARPSYTIHLFFFECTEFGAATVPITYITLYSVMCVWFRLQLLQTGILLCCVVAATIFAQSFDCQS